jgi:outer membrane protein assembly factor BamB
MSRYRVIVALSVILGMTAGAGAQGPSTDWPQWRGPERNGLSKETGLLKQWPASGPAQLWLNSSLGPGYGSIAVQGDRIYVQFATTQGAPATAPAAGPQRGRGFAAMPAAGPQRGGRGGGGRGGGGQRGGGGGQRGGGGNQRGGGGGQRGGGSSQSAVASLNRADGAIVWSKTLGPGGNNDKGSGPRSTPTIDGDRLYVLTETGDLACLKTQDGAIVWQRNILRDFNGRNINWLMSESPLVDGDKVIVTPGGRDAGVAALDKMTGKTLWSSKGVGDAGYASAIVADVGGVRTLMTLTSTAGVGVRESDGKVMWSYSRAANGTANVATPVFFNNKVFYTSGYGTGGGLIELTARDGEVTYKEVYFTRDMQNHHGGVVVVDGYLYGFNNAILTCLDFATGKLMWRDRSVGKGSLTYADGNLYILSENNVMGLVEATPTAYKEKGRFQIPDRGQASWAHPVVSGGRLYIRDQNAVASYDIRAK